MNAPARDQVGLRILFESIGSLLDRDGARYTGGVEIKIEVNDGMLATALIRFTNEESKS
jgi:hypothetical protein